MDIDSSVLVTLGLGGTFMMLLKSVAVNLWQVFIKQISTNLCENNENSKMFTAVTNWLLEHKIPSRIKSYRLANKSIAPGSYIVHLSMLSWCHITYKIEKRDSSYCNMIFETYELTFYGFGQKKYLDQIHNHVKLLHESSITRVYKANSMYDCVKHTKRSFDSIFIDKSIKQSIIDKLDLWKSNKHIYEQRGIIYKIGFCFYGPPGTGKTTLAKAIASYMDMDLYSIKLNKDIESVFRTYNGNAVYLFDDVDEFINGLNKDDAPTSYDQLLSFIDGTNSPQNTIIIFTTNFIEKLPDSLMRTGRIDYKHLIGPIDYSLAEQMCNAFNMTQSETKSLLLDKTTFLPCELQLKLLEHLHTKD